ncbi:MAG: hypothetical protein ACR2IV_03165 [Bryobacteraceae bacterium]
MSLEKSSRANRSNPTEPPTFIVRAFGALKVRPKLVVLHNVFFFVLAVSVYLSVIPVFSEHIASARQRELQMVSQIFAAKLPMNVNKEPSGLSVYEVREGSSTQLSLSKEGQAFLRDYPLATWQQGRDSLFRPGRFPGQYREVSLAPEFYEKALRQARISLFVALGTIYLLSIGVLEFMIMPQYVYRPLRLMLDADEAIQRDDRMHELIDERFILDDEIGQIMRSRNATVAQLRQQEDHLASALQKIGGTRPARQPRHVKHQRCA